MAVATSLQFTRDGTALQVSADGVHVQGLGGDSLVLTVAGPVRTSGGGSGIARLSHDLVSADSDNNGSNDLVEVFNGALADAQADDPSFPALTPAQLKNLMRAINLRGIEKAFDVRLAGG